MFFLLPSKPFIAPISIPSTISHRIAAFANTILIVIWQRPSTVRALSSLQLLCFQHICQRIWNFFFLFSYLFASEQPIYSLMRHTFLRVGDSPFAVLFMHITWDHATYIWFYFLSGRFRIVGYFRIATKVIWLIDWLLRAKSHTKIMKNNVFS